MYCLNSAVFAVLVVSRTVSWLFTCDLMSFAGISSEEFDVCDSSRGDPAWMTGTLKKIQDLTK